MENPEVGRYTGIGSCAPKKFGRCGQTFLGEGRGLGEGGVKRKTRKDSKKEKKKKGLGANKEERM